MAYTKPAVAMLLVGASARIGLAAQDNWNAPFADYLGAIIPTVAPAALGGAANTNLTVTPTTNGVKCVACIRSGNVWCSAKYLFERSGTTWTYPVIVASDVVNPVPTISATQDMGQCCILYADRITAGQVKPANATIMKNNMFTCWARFTNQAGAGRGNGLASTQSTQTAIVEEVGANKNWWCSSGRNNQVANATIVSAILTYNPATPANAGGNGDPRTELMLTNCRQSSTTCGGAATITAMTAVGAGATAQERSIVQANMNVYEKCTWIHASEKGAPTFKVIASTGSVTLNAKWDLHYSEYNTGTTAQPTRATNNLYYPCTTWSALKARMYDITQTTGKISLPQVWMWDVQPPVATGAGSAQKRWFPVQMAADQIMLQKNRNTAYSGLLTTYNTAKTTYDAAVKAPATKPDFFATLFNPPKKTAVPLRPAAPTQPADYAGVYQTPFPTTSSGSYTGPGSQITTTTVTANQFVVSGAHGGWGAWTMGLVAHTTYPVQRSFGVFGWAIDDGTYKAEAFSFTQDWKEMCITPAAAGSNGFCPTTAPALTANAVKSILVVSVWSNDQSATTFSGSPASSLKITFNLSNWAQNAAAWAKPTRPAAAVAPATPAGAKALAASAAVLVAAALY